MSATIITICNQKGGSGKTTLTMQLAGSLASRKKKVLVVDADPQATATRWASSSDTNTFSATVVGLSAAEGKVHREIKKFVDDYDYILIDCPPAADSPIPQSALLVSDLAIVPVIPSPLDMWASVGIKRIIENVSEINEGLIARLVVNQCQPNTLLAKDVLDILPEFGIPVCKNYLRQRVIYRQSALFGQTVLDMGSKARDAVQEIKLLTNEILKALKTK